MDPNRCSFFAGGEQCPRTWVRYARVLGKVRPVCEAHAHIQSVREGAIVMWDMKIMAMQREFEKTGDENLGKRLQAIAARARARDMRLAAEIYDKARMEAQERGVDDPHAEALLSVWRHARYPDGDPRKVNA